jgi:DeoR family transcriptional regulator, glycerol-3-phosphate regulon repressor
MSTGMKTQITDTASQNDGHNKDRNEKQNGLLSEQIGGKKTHRAVELLETLKWLGGSARTSQLAQTMDVSEETVRRTVKKLSKEGLLNRVHGGVYLASDLGPSSLHQRIGEQAREKQKMGNLVASLVKNGASLFLDVGSTTLFVAEALRDKHDLMVVTNSLSVAQTLMEHNNNRVFLAGGELHPAGGTFGAATQKFVSKFHLDMAILSAHAIDPVQGFVLAHQVEAELAQTYASHARKTILVADHSKTRQSAPFLSCDPADIDLFVTDRPAQGDLAEAMASWKIQVMVAPPKPEKSPKKKKNK